MPRTRSARSRPTRAKDKLLSRRTAATAVAGAKRRGERVVFTNGCFDLLHLGHVRSLEEARSLGDRLVVGLNSDASVRRLKGARRPLVPARQRAEVLAASRASTGWWSSAATLRSRSFARCARRCWQRAATGRSTRSWVGKTSRAGADASYA